MNRVVLLEKMEIVQTENTDDFKHCATLMSESEPWITLKRTYETSLKMISDPLKEIYIARINNKITGFMILQMVGTFRGYIQSIYVAPEYRNMGIGTNMLRFAERRIFKESPNIFVCVSSFNKKAQKLYRKLKYKKIGVLKDFIVPGHSEILLRKTTSALVNFRSKA